MIRTFVFFDLETTGLIGKTVMPRVTEMSLIAVSRRDICNTNESLPRVLHKLVLPINPNVHISKKIHTLTGLSNENLTEASYFNSEIYNLVMNFINRQTAPTCFVAYNGNNFDYPIFLSELKNIQESFSDNILSIDMLHLIKDFFSSKQNTTEKTNVAQTTISVSCSTDVNTLLNDGYDEVLSDALDTIMKTNLNNDNKIDPSVIKNETTVPSCSSITSTPRTNYYKEVQEINEKTPENQIVKLKPSDQNFQKKKEISARRKLNFTDSQPTNFKLSSICKHIFGTDPENLHSAEGDCLTMIRCAMQLGNYFVEWADGKAVPLNNYSKV